MSLEVKGLIASRGPSMFNKLPKASESVGDCLAQITAPSSNPFVIYKVGSISKSSRGKKNPSNLLNAAKHNLRQMPSGHQIDQSRSPLNYVLRGPSSPEGINELLLELCRDASIELTNARKDHVQAVEVLISLEFEPKNGCRPFFEACVNWIEARFGSRNVLSAVVHVDESRPHVHILIAPIFEGRLCGSKLINRSALARQKKDFESQVGQVFGIKFPPASINSKSKLKIAKLVCQHLSDTDNPVIHDRAWPCFEKAILKDPVPFCSQYGINFGDLR